MGKPITAEKLLGKIDSILNQGIIPLLGMVQKKKRGAYLMKRGA
jgi:hypothetical protein